MRFFDAFFQINIVLRLCYACATPLLRLSLSLLRKYQQRQNFFVGLFFPVSHFSFEVTVAGKSDEEELGTIDGYKLELRKSKHYKQ